MNQNGGPSQSQTGNLVPVAWDKDGQAFSAAGSLVPVVQFNAATSTITDPAGLAAVMGAANGATYQSAVVTVKSTADINAASAAAVANQVHTILRLPRGYWLESTPGVTATIDAMWCELDLNYGAMSCATWGATTGSMLLLSGSNAGVHDYTRYSNLKRSIYNGTLINDPAKYLGADNGPDLLTIDIPGVATNGTASARGTIDRVMFVGGRRNVIFGSGAYFMKFPNCRFDRAYQGFDTLPTGVHDYAEQIELSQCVIAENRLIWGPSAYGQICTLWGGSLDYNLQIISGSKGIRVHVNDVHIEHNYGGTSGQTLEPIYFNADAGGYFGGTCRWFYTGGVDPFFVSFAATNNASTQIDLTITKSYKLGRTSRTSYDAFHRSYGGGGGVCSLKLRSELNNQADFPAVASVLEAGGTYGHLRTGVSDPWNSMGHIIGRSGTAAAATRVTAAENGVALPTLTAEAGGGNCNMIKLQNSTPGTAAKYYLSFPKWERGRKMAWAMFLNSQATGAAGSLTIKEWRMGPAATFDGTAVTFAAYPEGTSYMGGTITITPGTDWSRYDHRDTAVTGGVSAGAAGNGTMDVQSRHEMSVLDVIEIDMTGFTGPLYIAKVGISPIGAIR